MKARAGILLVLALAPVTGRAGPGGLLPDDHGDTTASATAFSGPSNAVTGVLEYDTDADVFSFPLLPWRSYVIAVQTGTVWDVQLEVIPPDLSGAFWRTNSAWTDAALTAHWTNRSAASRWHLAVSGLLQFTTGTYHLAVWETPGQDTDGDGLADAWERHYFGDLDTADESSDFTDDGFPDLHAYLSGLSPLESLKVQTYSRRAGRDVVGWDVSPYGTYDLMSTTNLHGPWEFLHRRVAGSEGLRITWTNGAAFEHKRFYRIRFLY